MALNRSNELKDLAKWQFNVWLYDMVDLLLRMARESLKKNGQ